MRRKATIVCAFLALGVGGVYANLSAPTVPKPDFSFLKLESGALHLEDYGSFFAIGEAPSYLPSEPGTLSPQGGPHSEDSDSFAFAQEKVKRIKADLEMYLESRAEAEILTQHILVISSLQESERQKFASTIQPILEMISNREVDQEIFLEDAQTGFDELSGFSTAEPADGQHGAVEFANLKFLR